MWKDELVSYSILDPTGNITALVDSPIEIADQPSLAAVLMEDHPEVEQVGFVNYVASPRTDHQVELRMAGGEFCGNASMSAAALYALRCRPEGVTDVWQTVKLGVSGCAELVKVSLVREDEKSLRAAVRMPLPLAVTRMEYSFEGIREMLPTVLMEGISHIIIEKSSAFFSLKRDAQKAEQAVKAWCQELSAEGLGLMFLEEPSGDEAVRRLFEQAFCVGSVEEGEKPVSIIKRLTPLVYIPGSGTVFWENSCASGSSAVGMALADQMGQAVFLTLQEPGGNLWVKSSPDKGRSWLFGRVRLVGHFSLSQQL